MEKFNIDVLLYEIKKLKDHGFYVRWIVNTWENEIIIDMNYNNYHCREYIEDIHKLTIDQVHRSLHDRLLYMKAYLYKLELMECNNA